MPKLILAATASLLALSMIAPAAAAPLAKPGLHLDGATLDLDRKGRKKPRVPGGSGCDDPRDVIQHPECSP